MTFSLLLQLCLSCCETGGRRFIKRSSSSLSKLHTSCPLIKSGFYLLCDVEAIHFHHSLILQKLSPVEFMPKSDCSHELGIAAVFWPDLKFIDSSTFLYLVTNLGSQIWETSGISTGCVVQCTMAP